MTRKNNDTKRNGQIIRGALFANSGWCQINDDAMTGKMQARVLDRGLHTLAALLHGSVWESHNCDTGKSVSVIHFDFDDNSLESDNCTGKYARKHGGSVDEVMGNVN